MSLLDIYYSFVDDECEKLMKDSSSLKSLSDFTGLGRVGNMLGDAFGGNLLGALQNTPLYGLAEDWVAEQITENASRMVNALTGQLEKQAGGLLQAARNTAFSALTAAMTFQQELIYYFAMTCANKIARECDETIASLKKLHDAVRQLYNALVVLGKTGEYFEKYLTELRLALQTLSEAEKELLQVRSGWESRTYFNSTRYNTAKQKVKLAAGLILPDAKEPDIGISLNRATGGLLPTSIGINTDSARQYFGLQAMWEIPKLTWEMLDRYNGYILQVGKINLLIGQWAAISSPKVEVFQFFKDYVKKNLTLVIDQIGSLVVDMATELNGDPLLVDMVKTDFRPDPVTTSARATTWGVRCKAIQVLMEGLDVNSLDKLNDASELKQIHDKYLARLKKLDNLKGSMTLLRREDGKEELGDLEPHLLKLASQAVVALTDRTLVEKNKRGTYDPDTAVYLAQLTMERVSLSMTHLQQVGDLMRAYAGETKPKLGQLAAMGDAMLQLCDEAGLDRLKDLMEGGDVFSLFSMDSKFATYTGLALASLYSIKALLTDGTAQSCVEEAIADIKVKERAKKLQSERSLANNMTAQVAQNNETCSDLQKKKKKVEQCAGDAGFADALNLVGGALVDLPTLSDAAMGVFKGLLGGDMAPTSIDQPLAGGFGTSSTTTYAANQELVPTTGGL